MAAQRKLRAVRRHVTAELSLADLRLGCGHFEGRLNRDETLEERRPGGEVALECQGSGM